MAIDPKTLPRLQGLAANVTLSPAEAVEAARALPALLTEREELLALLREVEWSAWLNSCPSCGGLKIMPEDAPPGLREKYATQVGHQPRCRLAAFLGKE